MTTEKQIENTKICHLTSVHPRDDIRIYLKECKSLAKVSSFDVFLVVADGLGNEQKEGVQLIDVGKPPKRLSRIFKTPKKIFEKAIRIDASIYHLHDPELIPIGLKLLRKRKKVIFDAHEDFPKQLLSKPYLNTFSKFFLSRLFSFYENYAFKKYSGLIAATPSIETKLLSINKNSMAINNYPMLNEFKNTVDWATKKNNAIYVGGITEIRGAKEFIRAMTLANIKIDLIGFFSEQALEKELKNLPQWLNVNYHGFKDRDTVAQLLSYAKVGIVTFLPVPNHIDSQPNKMFEYMSAGLPVIASHFPLWKNVIELNNCGICVDPTDSNEIKKAIQYIIDNPLQAEKMGKNGMKAIKNTYNWANEEKKLVTFYKNLIETVNE